MDERTEELGLAGLLTLTVGGRAVRLRTLNLEESEDWQAKAGEAIARFDLPDSDDAAAMFAAFAKAPTATMLDLVVAYDLDRTLGGREALRKSMTQRELYAAIKQMVSAEAPFVQDVRSVAEAFGPQVRMVVGAMLARMAARSLPENSTNGHSPTGDSTLELSEAGSPKKGS